MKKLVVITGASGGIGLAIARKFSEQRHPLLRLARKAEPVQTHGLPNSLCIAVDVANYEAVKNAVTKAEEQFGPGRSNDKLCRTHAARSS